MNRHVSILARLGTLVALISLFHGFETSGAVTSAEVKKLFASPPREYATAPLWVWNDLLTEQQIRETMRDLAGQSVKQVFVHPRPGMMTPYLSPDWFRLWKVALDEAEKLDMNVWIYDENSYPSGFAGGWVPELMPESRGMGLSLKEVKTPPKWSQEMVSVLRLADDKAENVTAAVKAGESLPEGRFLVGSIVRAGNSPWHGDRCYVNLLTPGVTEKFLEVTLEAYKREIGPQFGKRVPGVFTDEPNIRPAGGFPWCPDLPEQFQKRWGYNLLDHLASLTREIGDWRKVRHNYFSTINDLFIERWGKPYYDWCDKNGLEFTGHYWDHEWPHCIGVPDNMAMAAWQHRPGIDTLMNQYAENTHAQFGNVRFCREISSIANQLGRKRTLVELYGAGGWDLRFEDMKRIGDWLQVLGINTMDEHLSYITLRGARKRDHPQSFSYHEPWWEAYHVSAQYLARLSCAMSQGEQINRVLVIEPTTTAWMYQGNEARLKQLGDAFFNLLMALESAQVEYDLASEDVMARFGSLDNDEVVIGKRRYKTAFLAFHENLDSKTRKLVERLPGSYRGIVKDPPPARTDGRFTGNQEKRNLPLELVENYPAPAFEVDVDFRQAIAALPKPDDFSIQRAAGDKGILFHHRRHIEDGQILLLVNTSIDSPSAGTIQSDLKGIECWNLNTGEVETYPFEAREKGVKASFNLPPSGSLLLFLSKGVVASNRNEALASAAKASRERQLVATQTAVRRIGPNVLTLDYVDVTAGGETRSNQYFYDGNQFAWQKNGMARNPWDSAVQFKNELIAKQFPADSGFTASYRFAIEGVVPTNLAIVIERPDLYAITCNGQPIAAKAGEWWLDKAFGKISIASVARVGENVVTVKASPFTMYHELEAAYVLGDFALKPAAHGFIIGPDQPLRLAGGERRLTHSINPDGTAWLSGGIGFQGGKDDPEPFVVLDLGQTVDLTSIKVWNYCEAHVRDLTARGADKVRITGSAREGAPFDVQMGTFRLSRATGEPATADVLQVRAKGVRFVRFEILSNHNGVQYPASGSPVDAGFVGLSEVQFLTGSQAKVTGVKVHRFSGELASHQRTAARLVDGSGLDETASLGWKHQGHPFYSQGVSYRETFNVPSEEGRYVVSLPKWHGSVAKVLVNGQPAGFIAAPPWECDVTRQIKRGENQVEVVVIGTLKNTLGPHHGNHALGSAWPGMFQNGPKEGPPPGDRYSTAAYGLFEPFVLKEIRTSSVR
jgi:hypothetical protein